MKNLIFAAIISVFMAFTFVACAPSAAQIRIAPPPVKVVKVRPAKPFKKAVWISGHWKWRAKKNNYVWVKGHWAKPRKSQVWIQGVWVKTPNGWKHKKGHWKRR